VSSPLAAAGITRAYVAHSSRGRCRACSPTGTTERARAHDWWGAGTAARQVPLATDVSKRPRIFRGFWNFWRAGAGFPGNARCFLALTIVLRVSTTIFSRNEATRHLVFRFPFLVTPEDPFVGSVIDPRAMASPMQTEAIPGLPQHVVSTHVLAFLEDPADLARFQAASHAARDAVDATERLVQELEEHEAANLACFSALRRLERRGLLDKRHFCTVAAQSGNLQVMKWARGIGCIWDEWTCHAAAEGGHLELLEYLRANACPWDEKTSAAAGSRREIEIIEWVHDNGCPWSEFTCANAAMRGNLEVLKFAREHFCPWNEWTCQQAAEHGHLDVLRWARAHEAPMYFPESVRRRAAENGHFDVLRWLRGNGWDLKTCSAAA